MRLSIFTLFLCFSAMACCQFSTPFPANPDKTNLPPLIFNFSGTDSFKNPPAWLGNGVLAQPAIVLRNPATALPMNHAQIDPKMIVHPPKSSLGVQPQGTLVAQNLYPGLRFLPIETSTAKLYPIPTPWPNLKIQRIPIVWPNYRILPVDSKTPNASSTPAK